MTEPVTAETVRILRAAAERCRDAGDMRAGAPGAARDYAEACAWLGSLADRVVAALDELSYYRKAYP